MSVHGEDVRSKKSENQTKTLLLRHINLLLLKLNSDTIKYIFRIRTKNKKLKIISNICFLNLN